MQRTIETLLLRNLQEVFGEGDPTRRGAAIAELYTEDCVVLLPLGRYVGRDALDRVAGELRAGHPNFVYAPHRPPQVVQNAGKSRGARGRPASRRIIRGSTSLSCVTEKSPLFSSSSIRCRRRASGKSRWAKLRRIPGLTTSCRRHASAQSSAPINLSRERKSTAGCSQFFARSGSMKFDRDGFVRAAAWLTPRMY